MINSKTCSMIGIDHGTTNSCAAIFRNGQIQYIDNADSGLRNTPSVVHFPPNGGKPLVGDEASEKLDSVHTYFGLFYVGPQLYFSNSSDTIIDMKRLIAKDIGDPAVAQLSRFFSFSMSEPGPDGAPPHLLVHRKQPQAQLNHSSASSASTQLNQQQPLSIRPLEVCSQILAKMVNSASLLLNNTSDLQSTVEVNRAVIAVPAKFTTKQRAETMQAARMVEKNKGSSAVGEKKLRDKLDKFNEERQKAK